MSKFLNELNDPTGELAKMRSRIMQHVERLQNSDNSHQRLTGDYIEIYIKRLEDEYERLTSTTLSDLLR